MCTSEEFSDPHAAECEIVGKADAVFKRQLDDEIHVFYGVGGPDEFIRYCCLAALREVAAHDGDDDIGTCNFTAFIDMIYMTIVEGIVFSDGDVTFIGKDLLYSILYQIIC